MIALIAAGFMLKLLFLGYLSYVYGAIFKSETRTHALNILVVDDDRGYTGESFSVAYSLLQSDAFPSLQFSAPTSYPTVQTLETLSVKETTGQVL